MAFETNQSTNRTFFKIKDGKFLINVKDGEPQVSDTFTGTLTGLDYKEVDHKGKKFEVVEVGLADSAGTYKLSLFGDSGYTITFLASLENVDLKKPVKLIPSEKEKISGEKVYKNQYLNINQNGQPIKGFYSYAADAENPIPRVDWVKVGKNNVKDSTKLEAFIKDLVERYDAKIKGEAVPTTVKTNTVTAPPAAPQAPKYAASDVEDDLPF